MLKDYLDRSREPRYSLLFALPLLVAYELFSFMLSGSAVAGVRNGADVLMKSLFVGFGGLEGLIVFNVLLLGTGAALVWRDARARPGALRRGVFLGMAAESLVYAALFGGVVARLTAMVLGGPRALQIGGGALDLPTQLVISLGAGIYEELLFRVLLTGGLLWAGKALLGWRPAVAAAVAVVLSALIFSGFHYVGPLGDRFTVGSFTFRAIAGVVFSAMYVTRGLGVTAWTHALYDLGLTLLQAG